MGPPPGAAPLHMLPVPRPMPAGAASHRGDMPFVIWVVVLALLSCFGAYYAFGYAYQDEQRLGGVGAMLGFALLAGLASIPWLRARGRRTRLLVSGRAVQGSLLDTTNVTVRTQHGGYLGHYRIQTIGFEDKQVRLRIFAQNTSPIVFVDGAWAGVYTPAVGGSPASVEMAKWGPRPMR